VRPRSATATGDQRINSFGIGGEVETRSGLHVQKQVIASPLVHFGLGEAAQGDLQTTRVIVTGLVSVASIASFKRHLGKLEGVASVGVSSGPDGEFVFAVGHGPAIDLQAAIPGLPGFAAQVTSVTDDAVSVAARDPEAES